MKAAAVVLVLVLLLSGIHITVPVGAWPVTVPLPVLVLLAELGVCAALGWLIAGAAGWRTRPFSRRFA
jgi:hypothetical protein